MSVCVCVWEWMCVPFDERCVRVTWSTCECDEHIWTWLNFRGSEQHKSQFTSVSCNISVAAKTSFVCAHRIVTVRSFVGSFGWCTTPEVLCDIPPCSKYVFQLERRPRPCCVWLIYCIIIRIASERCLFHLVRWVRFIHSSYSRPPRPAFVDLCFYVETLDQRPNVFGVSECSAHTKKHKRIISLRIASTYSFGIVAKTFYFLLLRLLHFAPSVRSMVPVSCAGKAVRWICGVIYVANWANNDDRVPKRIQTQTDKMICDVQSERCCHETLTRD